MTAIFKAESLCFLFFPFLNICSFLLKTFRLTHNCSWVFPMCFTAYGTAPPPRILKMCTMDHLTKTIFFFLLFLLYPFFLFWWTWFLCIILHIRTQAIMEIHSFPNLWTIFKTPKWSLAGRQIRVNARTGSYVDC